MLHFLEQFESYRRQAARHPNNILFLLTFFNLERGGCADK